MSDEKAAFNRVMSYITLAFSIIAAVMVNILSLSFFEIIEMIFFFSIVGGCCGLIYSVYGEKVIYGSLVAICFCSWFLYWVYIEDEFFLGFWCVLILSFIVSVIGMFISPEAKKYRVKYKKE